jgi:uncharacterized protein
MAQELKDILTRLQVGNDDLAAVVGPDGLPIESVGGRGLDVEAVCAVASDALRMAEAIGGEIGLGEAQQAIVEYDDTMVLIAPLSGEATLVVVSREESSLGRARFMIKRHRPDLASALQAV